MSESKKVRNLKAEIKLAFLGSEALKAEVAELIEDRNTIWQSVEALKAQNATLNELKIRHETTLAGRLLAKGANFICIEADEPYFLEVYRAVRQNAKRRGRWTDACEARFQEQVGFWMDREVVKEK